MGANSFGASVSLSSNTAAIGATFGRHDGGLRNIGTTHIFENDGNNNWTELVTLTANDPWIDGRFGRSVSIDNDVLVVSALTCAQPAVYEAGCAFIFGRDDMGVWSEILKLESSDAFSTYARNVAVSGSTILTSEVPKSTRESANVRIYSRDEAGSWLEYAMLIPSDFVSLNSSSFGYSLAIDGNRVAVGSAGGVRRGTGETDAPGAIYIFESDGFGAWTEQAIVIPSDESGSQIFGISVALAEDILIVGDSEADGSTNQTGAVFVFLRDSNGDWIQHDRLVASDGKVNDAFGFSVAYANGVLLVGTPHSDGSSGVDYESGSAYAFVRQSDGHWDEEVKITVSDVAQSEKFGERVSISDTHAIIGSPGDDLGRGSVYVFEIN